MRQPVSTATALIVGLAGATAVAFGAFGAHALRGVLDEQGLDLWRTAVNYHFWHALALALVTFAAPPGRSRRIAVPAFTIGIVLFSGSLYALALGAPRLVGVITPLGGVAFIVGWIALGFALRQKD
jgi:uncharacterized membrane protein YgdD (TMEM256/DUF423 family)